MRLIYSDEPPTPSDYEPIALADLISGDEGVVYTASSRLSSDMSGRYAFLPVRVTERVSHAARNMCRLSFDIVDADLHAYGSHQSLFVDGKLCQKPPLPLLSLGGSLVEAITFHPYTAYLNTV